MVSINRSKRPKVSKLDIPLWKFSVYFHEGPLYREAHKKVFGSETDFKPCPTTGAVTFVGDPNNRILIWLPQDTSPEDSTTLLAHEAAHAAFAICRKAGLELSESSEESYTYLIEHILSFLLANTGKVVAKGKKKG